MSPHIFQLLPLKLNLLFLHLQLDRLVVGPNSALLILNRTLYSGHGLDLLNLELVALFLLLEFPLVHLLHPLLILVSNTPPLPALLIHFSLVLLDQLSLAFLGLLCLLLQPRLHLLQLPLVRFLYLGELGIKLGF